MDFLCRELLFHLGFRIAAVAVFVSSSSLVCVAMLLESHTDERKDVADDNGAVTMLILDAGLLA